MQAELIEFHCYVGKEKCIFVSDVINMMMDLK
jgi:hypothetical protein